MIAFALIPILVIGQAPQAPARPKHARRHIVAVGANPAITAVDSKQADRVVYRKDAKFAVWDSRGLTIRSGQYSRSTRLPDISLTPKLFTREEILETKRLIKDGIRTKGASGLSGSRRVGDVIYFVPRWDEKDGKPWLEALIKVDLASDTPVAILLGRFEGLSLAHNQVDDKLFVRFGLPAIIGRKDMEWGVSTYDPVAKKFAFKAQGKGLVTFWHLGKGMLLAEEKTAYNSRSLVRVGLDTGERRVLAESHTGFVLLSAASPLIVRLSGPEGETLRNLDTGSELKIPHTAKVRITSQGVLVSTGDQPDQQIVYEPVRWTKVGR